MIITQRRPQAASADQVGIDAQGRTVGAGPTLLVDQPDGDTQICTVSEELSTATIGHISIDTHIRYVGGGGPHTRNGHRVGDAHGSAAIAGSSSPDPAKHEPMPRQETPGPVTCTPEPTRHPATPRTPASVRVPQAASDDQQHRGVHVNAVVAGTPLLADQMCTDAQCQRVGEDPDSLSGHTRPDTHFRRVAEGPNPAVTDHTPSDTQSWCVDGGGPEFLVDQGTRVTHSCTVGEDPYSLSGQIICGTHLLGAAEGPYPAVTDQGFSDTQAPLVGGGGPTLPADQSSRDTHDGTVGGEHNVPSDQVRGDTQSRRVAGDPYSVTGQVPSDTYTCNAGDGPHLRNGQSGHDTQVPLAVAGSTPGPTMLAATPIVGASVQVPTPPAAKVPPATFDLAPPGVSISDNDHGSGDIQFIAVVVAPPTSPAANPRATSRVLPPPGTPDSTTDQEQGDIQALSVGGALNSGNGQGRDDIHLGDAVAAPTSPAAKGPAATSEQAPPGTPSSATDQATDATQVAHVGGAPNSDNGQAPGDIQSRTAVVAPTSPAANPRAASKKAPPPGTPSRRHRPERGRPPPDLRRWRPKQRQRPSQ